MGGEAMEAVEAVLEADASLPSELSRCTTLQDGRLDCFGTVSGRLDWLSSHGGAGMDGVLWRPSSAGGTMTDEDGRDVMRAAAVTGTSAAASGRAHLRQARG